MNGIGQSAPAGPESVPSAAAVKEVKKPAICYYKGKKYSLGAPKTTGGKGVNAAPTENGTQPELIRKDVPDVAERRGADGSAGTNVDQSPL